MNQPKRPNRQHGLASDDVKWPVAPPYYFKSTRDQIGSRFGESKAKPKDGDPTMCENSLDHGGFARRAYGRCDGLQSHKWFFEEHACALMEGSQTELFLPSMRRVLHGKENKKKGGGGLFDKRQCLHDNAYYLLLRIHGLMHESHHKEPEGEGMHVSELSKEHGCLPVWQWKLPWMKLSREHGESSTALEQRRRVGGDGGPSLRKRSGTRDVGVGGKGVGPWLCSHYSKVKMQREGNKDGHHFCVHEQGYLEVKLGRDEKGRTVYENAHRIVLWANCGPPKPRVDGLAMCALHACDNPTCLCVAHLSWDTYKANNHFNVKRRKTGSM